MHRPAILFALRLCPRKFRERYGEEIAKQFDQQPSFREFCDVLGQGAEMHIESLWLNLLLTFRSLRRSWVVAVVAILAIAFGVGANVLGASILNAALLHPLPVPDPKQVYYASDPGGISYAEGRALANSIVPFGSGALSEPDHKSYLEAGRRIILSGALVDPGYFAVLRVRPMLGTLFDNSIGASSIVLSDKFWRRSLGGNVVVGTTITLSNRPYRVIGVTPSDFHGLPQYDTDAAYWLPLLQTQPGIATDASFTAVIRTKAGLAPDAAASSIRMILDGIARAHQKNSPCCASVILAESATLSRLWPLIEVIYAITWIGLIIGCVNVTNLQLGRNFAASFARATRAALGATPGQITAEIITDVAILSTIGCLLGLAIAWGCIRVAATSLPVFADVRLSAAVVSYAIALIALTSALIAVFPCVAQGRANIALVLKGVGQSTISRRGRRFIGGLVFVQVAFATMLVLTCGAVLAAFQTVQNASNGFSTRNLYVAAIDVSQNYSDSTSVDTREDYIRRTSASVVTLLLRTPGILDAAAATQAPFFCCVERNFSIPNGPSDRMSLYAAISPKYFSALSRPLVLGRSFDEHDKNGQQNVAIVDTLFAQRYFGKSNVLGERLVGRANYRIVGVVPPIAQEYGVPPKPMVYLAMAQFPRLGYIIVHTNGSLNDVGHRIAAVVHTVDPFIPVPTVLSYDDVIRMRETPSIVGTWTIAVFSVVALALALSGVYAVAAFSSQSRQREFAIRSALGASRSRLLFEAVKRPLVLALGAVIAGTMLSFILTSVMSAALSIYMGSSIGAVVVAFGIFSSCVFLATIVPAFRALQTNSMGLLRTE